MEKPTRCMAEVVNGHFYTPPLPPLLPGVQSTFPGIVLTISQMGKGTLRRTWELSEVTDWTPAHHRMEYSQGSFTV